MLYTAVGQVLQPRIAAPITTPALHTHRTLDIAILALIAGVSVTELWLSDKMTPMHERFGERGRCHMHSPPPGEPSGSGPPLHN